jgi:mannose/fructose/N-acetylgalactosamine-specific phosphotransferase system component IID
VSGLLRGRDLAQAASRSFHIQALLNPERMQGLGFGFALLPVLRRLYPETEARAAALRRHLAYFATHPVLAGFVLGVAARLEERRAAGEPIDDAAIDGTKRALASPLAALGDPLFWVTLRPLSGLIGVIAMLALPAPATGEPDLRVLLCPLLTLLTYNAVALPYRVTGVALGYAWAERPATLLRALKLAERGALLGRAGSFAFGAFVALTFARLDIAATLADGGASSRVLVVAPLLLGGLIGFVGRRGWPGRPVEVALIALAAAFVLAAWV